jgi:hypothetical protein
MFMKKLMIDMHIITIKIQVCNGFLRVLYVNYISVYNIKVKLKIRIDEV